MTLSFCEYRINRVQPLPCEFQAHCLKIFVEQRWIIIVWKHCRRSKYFSWKGPNGNDIFPIWNFQKRLILEPILTKLLNDPNGTEDLLIVYMMTQFDFLSLKQKKKQPPIQDTSDPAGSASAAVTAMLTIIYLPICIIISKLVLVTEVWKHLSSWCANLFVLKETPHLPSMWFYLR